MTQTVITPTQPTEIRYLNPNGNLSERALNIVRRRYAQRVPVEFDADGRPKNKPDYISHDPSTEEGYFRDQAGNAWWAVEAFRDVCWRVASVVAEPEQNEKARMYWRRAFFTALYNQEFVPNSPTWWAAGQEGGQLSACFVVGPEGVFPEDPDSMEAITRLQRACQFITHSGGGIGIHLGALRPRGSPVRGGAHGTALGPVAVLQGISDLCHRLTQRGKREAAGMCILPVGHPDVVEFITAKTEEGSIHNFNISLAVPREFMRAAHAGKTFELHHPKWRASREHFPESFREHIKAVHEHAVEVDAKALLRLIAEHAHRNGEPGLFFVDEANQEAWADQGVRIRGTNPCGEQPLPDFGVCNLGHINLAKCVENGKFDVAKYRRLTRLGTRFLDNVIDANTYPLPEITQRAEKYRNIGLGILGYADLLLEMGIDYGSEDALDLACNIERVRRDEAEDASQKLAEEKGSPWGGGRRNLILLTIAPTGSTSQVADVEGSGIEPIFSPGYWRRDHVHNTGVFVGSKYLEHPAAKFALAEFPDEENEGETVRRKYQEVTWKEHVETQAAFQEYNDSGISKTINLPNDATVEDVEEAYLYAANLGCKGITVYRDGSREEEVLSTKKKEGAFDPTRKKKATTDEVMGELRGTPVEVSGARKRPRGPLPGTTEKVETGYGTLYVTVNWDHQGPVEVFTQIGKTGGYTQAFTEAIGRLISLCAREGVSLGDVAEQLEGIRSPRVAFGPGGKVLSVPDGIAKALGRAVDAGHPDSVSTAPYGTPTTEMEVEVEMPQTEAEDAVDATDVLLERGDSPECPECSVTLRLQEGCIKCPACGFSEC